MQSKLECFVPSGSLRPAGKHIGASRYLFRWISRQVQVRMASNLWFRRAQFGSPTSRATLEHMAVMKQAVEHRADSGGIPQKLTPVFNRTVGGQQRAGPFISSHDDLQKFFGGRQWQLAHSEIVNDE